MCNLYAQRKPREELRGLFNISRNRAIDVEPQAGIFPGCMAPVVRRAEDGDLELVKLSWGFVLLREGYAPKRVTNVRDDQILRSKFWRGSLHWFALKGDDPRPTFAFPGIWRRYNGPIRKSGANVELNVYAFLTTTPNSLVAMINHERMPVLLSKPEEFDQWLNGTPKEALELAREYPPDHMRIVREGFDKEDPWLDAA